MIKQCIVNRTVVIVLIFFSLFINNQASGNASPLTLQESIDLALKQSLAIHSAKEKVKGADAQKKEALTEFFPKLSTSYSYMRLNEAPTYSFPGLSFTLPTVPPTPVTIPSSTSVMGTVDNYNWSFEARQPLFTGGGLIANYEINKLGVDIANVEEVSAIQDIILEVKLSYFNILKALKILDVARKSVEQLIAHRDMAQNYFDVGLIPRNDLLHAEVELVNGQQFLIRAENGVEMAKSKFNMILRRDINAPVEVEDILTYKRFEKSLDSCMAEAFENRSEIKDYTLKLKQAKTMVKMTRSEYFPHVSLIGNYTKFGDDSDVSGSIYKDQESWYILAVASWNFWEWGKTKNRVDWSISRENQMADALSNVKDQIRLEVKNTYLLLKEAEKEVQASKKAIEQAEENFRISTERYQEQMSTSTDVLDAQTLLTKAKSDYTNALGDYNIGQARLEKSIGVIYSKTIKVPNQASGM